MMIEIKRSFGQNRFLCYNCNAFMNKIDFITIGGATEDVVFYTNEGVLLKNKSDLLKQELLAFEQGAKVKVEKSLSFFGGGASNSAVNLANLGFETAIVANIGDGNRGKRILNNLKEKKVNISLVSIDKKNDSGFSFILNNGKDRIIFAYRGSNDKLVLKRETVEKMKKGNNFYITSLSDDWYQVLKKVFSLNKKVYWNPGLREISCGLNKISNFLNKTEVLMLNKDEALELVKNTEQFKRFKNSYLNNIRNLLKIIKEHGPKKVLITNGLKGAYFFDGDNFYHQLVKTRKKRLDTTGVGDAFNSTFSAGLVLFSGDYKKSLEIANKNASSLVSIYGAQNGLINIKDLLNKN